MFDYYQSVKGVKGKLNLLTQPHMHPRQYTDCLHTLHRLTLGKYDAR